MDFNSQLSEELQRLLINLDEREIKTFLEKLDITLETQIDVIIKPEVMQTYYELLSKKINGIAIGDIFLKRCLQQNIQLSPSLILYFYMREKNALNFGNIYNNVEWNFNYLGYTDHVKKSFGFDFSNLKVEQRAKSVEDFNYRALEVVYHELWHIYQYSISKDATNPLQKLILNDIEIFNFVNENLNYNGMHDALLLEYSANEFARRKILEFVQRNRECYSPEFIESKIKNLDNFYKGIRNPRSWLKNFIGRYMLEEYPKFYSDIQELSGSSSLSEDKRPEVLKRKFDELMATEDKLLYESSTIPFNYLKVNLGIEEGRVNDLIIEPDKSQEKEIDSDVDLLIKAIEITDSKYHKGAAKWQDFLRTGNLDGFTRSDGARDLLTNINHEELNKKVLLRICKNLSRYLDNPFSSTKSQNSIANELIEYASDPSFGIQESFVNLTRYIINNNNSEEMFKLLTGDIERIKDAVRINSVTGQASAYFKELEKTGVKEISKVPDVSNANLVDEYTREYALLEEIKRLREENHNLSNELQFLQDNGHTRN